MQMGKTPSRDNLSYWCGDNIWVSIADLKSKYIDSTKEHITDLAVSESGIHKVPQGTAIMSFKLTIGRAAITKCDLFTNEAIMSFEPKDANILLPDYVFYYLKGFNWTGANKAVMGQTLNKKTISENIFAYPSIEVQSQIVKELDLLQSIIDKQKAQLKELDNLAQAVFYDMFGDPVENEKGWEVKKLGDMCNTITKGTTPTTLGYSFVSEGINFVKVESFKDGKIDTSKLTHITKDCHDALSRSQLDELDLLVCIAGATIGKTAVVDKSILPANTNQACAIIRLKDKGYLAYIQKYLMSKFKNDVEQMGKGVAQPNLSLGQMRDLSIPLPPLSLQQSFAAKIEAIERQKTAIGKCMAETKKLFDYSMDKYFG